MSDQFVHMRHPETGATQRIVAGTPATKQVVADWKSRGFERFTPDAPYDTARPDQTVTDAPQTFDSRQVVAERKAAEAGQKSAEKAATGRGPAKRSSGRSAAKRSTAAKESTPGLQGTADRVAGETVESAGGAAEGIRETASAGDVAAEPAD